jgi:thioredoxin 1
MSKSNNLQNNDELQTLLNYPGPVVIYCWANWCVRCHMISPLIEKLFKEYKDYIKLVRIDIDENPKIASELGLLGINSIPVAFIFKGGELAEKIMGTVPYEKFAEAVDKNLA